MKFRVLILVVSAFIICLKSFGQSTLTSFKKGSLIIPMDNSKQNLIASQVAFNVKAYGLVNALLQNNIPVNWVIKDAKAKDAIDFSVLSGRLFPSTTSATLIDYKSGPFVIDSLWAATALPIITAYGNSVAVYKAELAFTAPVRYELMFKPKIAVFTNGNSQGVHTKALRLAGFSSPAHFDSIPAQNFNANSCYTFGCEPHWSSGQNAAVTSKVTLFLNSGGNFLAQCAGIDAYEHFEHYHTTNGITYETSTGSQDNNNLYLGTDQPLMQFEGNLTNAPTGTIVNYKNNSGAYQPLTQFLVKKSATPASGIEDGDVVLSTRKTGTALIGGNATYLGGHDYLKGSFDLLDLGFLGLDFARAGDITWNNGLRIFYNAIFVPSTRPTACNFVFAGEASVVATVSDLTPCLNDTIEYSVSFTNLGPGTAHNIAVKTTAAPSGLNYLSNTVTQGTYSLGGNSWTIGDLSPNTTVQLTLRYKVVADGSYALTCYNANLIAGNSFVQDTSTVVIITNQNSPVIAAPANINTVTNSGCTVTGINLGTPTVTDECGIASLTNNAPSSFPLGITTVTWTVIDNSGNTTTATQLVTVTDNQNPTITAPANSSTVISSGCSVTGINLGTPTTGDNCGVASVTNNAPATFPIGVTTVIWTVTDNSGNTATANQTVTVTDDQNPTITAPANINTTTNSGCSATGLNLGTPTTADNCGVASVTNNAPATFPLGTTTVIWTVTDNSGNTTTANQTVTVTDNVNPTITAPANINTSTNSGCNALGLDLGMPTTADNCNVASITNTAPLTFPLGVTTVIWTVMDYSGNTASANQTVTITDTQNPTITAPGNINTTANSGCTATGLNLGTPTTADNCGVASVTNNAPATFPLGTTTVIWTVTDNAGNAATATQTVTVTDNQNPTITAPANVLAFTNAVCDADVNLGSPTTDDNCGVASVMNDAPATFPLSTTTVTWTVTDNSGNTATATQTVTVTDNQNPTITAPGNINTTTNSGCTATGINSGTPTTADNCGVASVTNNAPSIFPLGITTVTWTVTDNSGNTATATQTVTVTDNQNPTITAPGNINTTTNSGCTATGLNLGTPTTADNCGIATVTNNAPASLPLGTTTVIWTVTDNSGNSATATQTVTVTDNESPAIVNCSDTIRSCESFISFDLPQAVDNCTLAAFDQIDLTGLTSGSNFTEGFTTLQYQAMDQAGNEATCEKVIYRIKLPDFPNAGSDKTINTNETVLNATPDSVGTGSWSVLEGMAVIANEHDPKSVVSGLEKGTVTFVWSMSNEECESGTDTVRITYLDFNIPNAFSPDGDNKNDFFEIKGIENYAPVEIIVSNRWGEIVHESNDYQNNWGGQNKNGLDLTDDTYYYHLILNDGTEFSGFVIVKRK